MLKDTKKVMDTSLDGLRQLYKFFLESVKSTDNSHVGPSTFRQVLSRHGIRDTILMGRLYKDFCELPDRINYREFIRILCSVNDEPIEERVGMLFEVWDVDHNGSLTHSELVQDIAVGMTSHEIEKFMHQFNRVWAEIWRLAYGESQNWIGPSRSAGVPRDDLVDATRKPGLVRDYFVKVLTRQPPHADDRDRPNFQARLRELEAEIMKEMRSDERKEAERKQGEALENSRNALRSTKSNGRIGTHADTAQKAKLGASQHLETYKLQASSRLTRSHMGNTTLKVAMTSSAKKLPLISLHGLGPR